jgi:hypothetical protein
VVDGFASDEECALLAAYQSEKAARRAGAETRTSAGPLDSSKGAADDAKGAADKAAGAADHATGAARPRPAATRPAARPERALTADERARAPELAKAVQQRMIRALKQYFGVPRRANLYAVPRGKWQRHAFDPTGRRQGNWTRMHSDYLSSMGGQLHVYTALLYLTGSEDPDLVGGETGFADAFDDPRLAPGVRPSRGLVVEPARGRLVAFTSGAENFHCGLPALRGGRWFMQAMFDCDECAAAEDGWDLAARDAGFAAGPGAVPRNSTFAPCLNGAECVDGEKRWTCRCDEGFGGARCGTRRPEGAAGERSGGESERAADGGAGGAGGAGAAGAAAGDAAGARGAPAAARAAAKRRRQVARLLRRFRGADEAAVRAALEAEGWHGGRAARRLEEASRAVPGAARRGAEAGEL